MKRKNFTLVEIMIVVAIIGLLAAIAIPSFINARNTSRKNACINNLRQIDGAKEQWALANNKSSGDAVTNDFAALVGANGYIKATPVCASGGTYTVGNIGANPTCSKSADGHTL
jgi:prepilin-type N-terminal cleavage/methylation domain-containing protein